MFEIGSQALMKYYDTLDNVGYITQKNVNALLCLLFLNDFKTIFAEYLEQNDVEVINKALECLRYSSCVNSGRAAKQIVTTSDKTYIFAMPSSEPTINYKNYLTTGNIYEGDVKGKTLTLDVTGTAQKVIVVSTRSDLSLTYNTFVFPTTFSSVDEGYMYNSMNNYSQQKINIDVK